MMPDIHALARQLARPVARGHLTLTDADVALVLAAKHLPLSLDPARAAAGKHDVLRGAQFALRAWLTVERDRRAATTIRVCRIVAPMIARRAPRNALLAEAHGVNGADAFPFTEPEIEEIVRTEVWYALPAPVARRHGP